MPEIKDADLSGMCKPQAGASWWSGTGGPEDDLKDIIDALKENLAASQAREQGLLLVIAEMRAALYFEVKTAPSIYLKIPATCRGCLRPKGGWPNPREWENEHEDGCWVAAILAADPVERGALLLKAREEDADNCIPCQSKVYSGIGSFPWTCKFGHTVYRGGGPLTARHRIKPAQKDG